MASTPHQNIPHCNSSNVEQSCGYVTYFLTNVLAITYFLWAFLPDHIIKQIDEQYGTYYPPRELAVYIPCYLFLLFIFVPVLYMGLNMLSAPKVDDISTIWDTRSNECAQSIHDLALGMQSSAENHATTTNNGCHSGCECSKCVVSGEASANFEHCSVPSICDLDVRLANRYMQQLEKLD